jgi:hypothetical protein
LRRARIRIEQIDARLREECLGSVVHVLVSSNHRDDDPAPCVLPAGDTSPPFRCAEEAGIRPPRASCVHATGGNLGLGAAHGAAGLLVDEQKKNK